MQPSAKVHRLCTDGILTLRDPVPHHAFPGSARHGLHRWQVDMSWILIRSLEKIGLVWNVRKPTPEQMARRRVQPAEL